MCRKDAGMYKDLLGLELFDNSKCVGGEGIVLARGFSSQLKGTWFDPQFLFYSILFSDKRYP